MKYPPHTWDDLSLGEVFHAGPRAVSRADIDTFTEVSGDRTALHTDDAYAARTPLGGLVAHGVLNLAIATGLAYEAGLFEGTVLAFRRVDVGFDRPVRPGDELSLELEVSQLDPRPRPDRGSASFSMRVRNQDGKTVLSGTWTLLLRRTASS
ncbi:MAG: dehydratase [Planctomycetes bacterium]|nr:dehydratase [Planctomycetota bacterium]